MVTDCLQVYQLFKAKFSASINDTPAKIQNIYNSHNTHYQQYNRRRQSSSSSSSSPSSSSSYLSSSLSSSKKQKNEKNDELLQFIIQAVSSGEYHKGKEIKWTLLYTHIK